MTQKGVHIEGVYQSLFKTKYELLYLVNEFNNYVMRIYNIIKTVLNIMHFIS